VTNGPQSAFFYKRHQLGITWINDTSDIMCPTNSVNLEPLLLELPDFCLQSKAVNTRRSYGSAFNKWCKWYVPYNISTLPASDVNVSLYIMHLSKFKKSTSTINEAFYAISWAHNIAGVVNPCNSELVSFVKEGALRVVGRFVKGTHHLHHLLKAPSYDLLVLKALDCKQKSGNSSNKGSKLVCTGWFIIDFHLSDSNTAFIFF
jgi:hypothetical protein